MSIATRLEAAIRTIPDFPKKGIQFKDITPGLKDPALCAQIVDALVEPFIEMNVDMIAGIESRGFLFGPLMAQRLGCGFTLVRKKGKLPGMTLDQSYDLEYGQAVIEIHADALDKGKRVVIHDDLLATGGTAAAAGSLIQKAGGEILGFNFLIELAFLEGAKQLRPYGKNIVSIVKYS
ncbi:MAG: adenine phosphoribosyltransferase [Flavobacteriales bacterium]|nr:adenine phosphoribosyltransferase [Flavobacteriales bacterium]